MPSRIRHPLEPYITFVGSIRVGQRVQVASERQVQASSKPAAWPVRSEVGARRPRSPDPAAGWIPTAMIGQWLGKRERI